VNEVRRKGPAYSIYKPLPKADAGAAVQFKWAGGEQNCMFIEAARQRGERLPVGDKTQFDWSKENKITFKLNFADLGKIMMVLAGKTKEADLIHQMERQDDTEHVRRQSTLKLIKQSKNSDGSGYDNYSLRMTKVETTNNVKGPLVTVQIYINHEEMAIISVLFRKAIETMFEF
jgi:hypothetical protein